MKKGKIISIVGIVLGIVITGITVGLIKTKDIKTYLVTFDTNGGSVIEKQVINDGEKVIKPKDPVKDGYDFIEWTYDGKLYDFSLSVTTDMLLEAEWLEQNLESETFVVRFNSDGGTTIANQIIEKDDIIEKPIDPIKKGYKFIGWYLNDVLFSFEKVVNSDLELIAKWEKLKTSSSKKEENDQSSSTNKNEQTESDKKQNNNTGITSDGNTLSESTKLSTPKISVAPMGGLVDNKGTWGIYLELDKVKGLVEIYYSESKDGEYTLLRTAEKADEGNDCYEVTVPLGKHYYFKVRLKENKVYSEYSNILDYDNSLAKPTISIPDYSGTDEEGNELISLILNKIQGTVEIYYSENENGKYTLLRTATAPDISTNEYKVTVPLGKHYYYKVRLTANGEYSEYSNIVDYDNSLEAPKISVAPMGGLVDNKGTWGIYLELDKVKGLVEIYYSESKDGEYTLLRTAEKADEGNDCYEVAIPLEKHYYFKVRLKANNEYSNFSNVVDFDNN